nr:MAG TPA: hypothetical protein [Caudoviricetes sp.]
MQYLDLLGLQQLWTSAKAKFATKGTLANSGITDGYSSIETGSVVPIKNLENGILADIITGSDDHKLKTQYVTVDATGGLATTNYVDTKVGAVKVPAYTLTKSTSTNYAAVYHLQKDGANVGEAINIPKDMVVESGKVVWGSYSDGAFTPATDKKDATPYVELTLANSTANKIYIAVADLVNEHKAGTGISITNNTDGTRTIALTATYNTMVNAAVKAFGTDAEHPVKFIAKTNSGTVDVFTIDPTLRWADTNPLTLGVSDGLTGMINDADTLSKTNKTGLEALTKRVDGIVATGGEANQDAYSNIKVGATTLAATSKTDTVAFEGGRHISVAGSTADGNKSVSFSHAVPTGAATKTVGFYKFATDSTGHAISLTAVAASDITALIGAHSLTLSKTNAANDTAAITIGRTSYTVGPIPLGDETNPAKDTVRYILNH